VFVKTTDAPRFYKGYRSGLVIAIIMTLWIPVVDYFDRRQQRKLAFEDEVIYSQSSEMVSQVGAASEYGKKGQM
jgi:ACS family pantothenate transporter-like MFS transporter